MKKITVYEPVCSDNSSKMCFTVNGAIDADRDYAISKAKKHVAFREGNGGKIERVNEHQVWDEEFYSTSNY